MLKLKYVDTGVVNSKLEFEQNYGKREIETHDALAEVWNELNNGQRKKLLKNEKIAELLRRYGVIEAD